MKPLKLVYIALGSNRGNKLHYIQSAVDTIFDSVGFVKKLSRVFKTPALGFEGDDFYNACITVETHLSPKKLLKTLQQIEKSIGRSKKTSNGYESREIDLDIIFYESDIIQNKNLIIPHPEIQNRKFVLQPLLDILKDFEHPVSKKSIETLFEECKDDSVI